MTRPRKVVIVLIALPVGYTLGAMGFLVWLGYHLYKDMEERMDDFSWDDFDF